MKLILNNSTLSIMSHTKENRHKEVVNATIKRDNTWYVAPGNTGFFIDIKNGDSIVMSPNTTTKTLSIAFVSSKTIVSGESPTFANDTSERINTEEGQIYEGTAVENCYLFVTTNYRGTDDFTPSNIVINGFTLDNDGWV